MRKIVLIAVVLFLFVPSVNAAVWCQWDGSRGINCKSDNLGRIQIFGDYWITAEEEICNEKGYYLLTTTYPSLGENQVRDQEVWDLTGNQMSRTWTIRDLTAEEIDQGIASPMSLSEYYLWKALILKGVITQQEAANALPQELIDAYLARDRLINP